MENNELYDINFGSNIDISDNVTDAPVEKEVVDEERPETSFFSVEEETVDQQKAAHDSKTNVNETVPTHEKRATENRMDSDYFRGSRKKGAVQKIKKEIRENGYILADGEQEYTRYDLGIGNKIILTNRRLIALNESMQQVEIEKVTGLSTCYKKMISKGKIVLSILLLLLGAVAGFAGYMYLKTPEWLQYVAYGVAGVMIIIGIVLIATSMSKKFFLTVYTEPMATFLVLKSGTLSANKTDNMINVAVNKEAFFAANLIGADILTLKKEL